MTKELLKRAIKFLTKNILFSRKKQRIQKFLLKGRWNQTNISLETLIKQNFPKLQKTNKNKKFEEQKNKLKNTQHLNPNR